MQIALKGKNVKDLEYKYIKEIMRKIKNFKNLKIAYRP